MRNFDNNFCDVCGVEISSSHIYCKEHYKNSCKCGNLKFRDDEFCSRCRIENEKLINGFGVCPICNNEFKYSEYLNKVILNEKTRLIANLITHYRHEHQKSWENQYKYISNKYNEFVYDKAKSEHNNRAKRQILRKCKKWIIDNNLSKQDFLELQDNDLKTIELINKSFI